MTEIRNRVTVSVKVKRSDDNYGNFEILSSYTTALDDNASYEDFELAQAELFGALSETVKAQANQLLQIGAGDQPLPVSATPNLDKEFGPATTAKPVNPPKPAKQTVSAWNQLPYPPKADGRVIGQCWAQKVLSFEKGAFTSKNGKEFQAVKLWLENGKFPVKEMYVFHNNPAYPAEGTPYRDFFTEGGQFDIADKGVYVVMGVTGVERDGKLDIVPMAFTTKPSDVTGLLPALGTEGGPQ